MRKPLAIVLTGAALALGACGDVRENLSLRKEAPDEFAVTKRAPLEMPPSYQLPPPRPGAPRPQEQETAQQARQAILGADTDETQGLQTSSSTATATEGESLLLQKAGGSQADPDIRQTVDRETATMGDRNKPVVEKLLGIGGDSNEPSATIVNAPQEAERLRQNLEEGKAPTEGETPVIED